MPYNHYLTTRGDTCAGRQQGSGRAQDVKGMGAQAPRGECQARDGAQGGEESGLEGRTGGWRRGIVPKPAVSADRATGPQAGGRGGSYSRDGTPVRAAGQAGLVGASEAILFGRTCAAERNVGWASRMESPRGRGIRQAKGLGGTVEPLKLLTSMLPFAAKCDPERKPDQLEVQPKALLFDIEGVISKLVPAWKVPDPQRSARCR